MSIRILVIDDEQDIRELLKDILEDEGFEVSLAGNGLDARTALNTPTPMRLFDLILLDIWMPDVDGISLLKEWRESEYGLPCPVIMMSGHGTLEHAIEATRLGAYDFLEKPLTLAKLLLIVNRALESDKLNREKVSLKRKFVRSFEPIGHSRYVHKLKEQLIKAASLDQAPILLYGESGVGKQSYAQYIHQQSVRKHNSFVTVNVAAISKENASIELFGHENADGSNISSGLFEQAHGGIIYLNDIGKMNLAVQAKVVSTIEAASFFRVGGKTSIKINMRIIASSTDSLEEKVKAGEFREDLFYRLNVIPITILPLREHVEDVPALLNHYVDYFLEEEGLNYRKFSMSAQNHLRSHQWLGNISELKNLVQRLMIFGTKEDISLNEVEDILQSDANPKVNEINVEALFLDLPLKEAREQFERHYLLAQFKDADGNIAKVADKINIERTNLYRKLKSLGINPKK